MTDTEKWKARARELLPKARFDNEVRLGYTGEDDQTIISIKVCSLRAAIAAALAEAAADEREAQQELDAQLCDIAAAGHDEAFAAADRDPALTETQREAIKDRIAARSRTASGLATAIRARSHD